MGAYVAQAIVAMSLRATPRVRDLPLAVAAQQDLGPFVGLTKESFSSFTDRSEPLDVQTDVSAGNDHGRPALGMGARHVGVAVPAVRRCPLEVFDGCPGANGPVLRAVGGLALCCQCEAVTLAWASLRLDRFNLESDRPGELLFDPIADGGTVQA